MSTLSQFMGGGVKSIQKKQVNVGYNGTTFIYDTDVAIDAVNVSKTVINVTSTAMYSTSSTILLTSPTNVHIATQNTQGSINSANVITFDVIEYF